MANLSFWAKVLFVQSGFILLYWLWQFQGVQGAGGLLTVLMWVTIFATVVNSLLLSEAEFNGKLADSPRGRRTYNRIAYLVWIAALAWAGATFTGFALLIAFGLLEMRYSRTRVVHGA